MLQLSSAKLQRGLGPTWRPCRFFGADLPWRAFRANVALRGIPSGPDDRCSEPAPAYSSGFSVC